MRIKRPSIAISFLALSCTQPLCAQGSPTIERFETTNGAIAFGEVATPEAGTVGYFVDILDNIGIFAAAFSFQQLPANPSTDVAIFFSGGAGWSGEILDEVDWDNGTEFFVGALTYNTASFGTFDSLFGTVDNTVVVFSDDIGTSPLTEDNDFDEADWTEESTPTFARLAGTPATTGIFFDDKGNIIGASPVPEPSGVLLLSLASIGILARRRRA